MEGAYLSNHYSVDDPSPAVRKFVDAYKAKYGAEPDSIAALSYDATRLLADAIARAGSTEGKRIRDALAATKDFAGVTGTITMDADRNPIKPAVILKVEGGRFRFADCGRARRRQRRRGAGSADSITNSSNEASPGPAVASPSRPVAGLRVLRLEAASASLKEHRHAPARRASRRVFSHPRSNVAGRGRARSPCRRGSAESTSIARIRCRRAAARKFFSSAMRRTSPLDAGPLLDERRDRAVLEDVRCAGSRRRSNRPAGLSVRPATSRFGAEGGFWSARISQRRWARLAEHDEVEETGRAHDRVGVEVIAHAPRPRAAGGGADARAGEQEGRAPIGAHCRDSSGRKKRPGCPKIPEWNQTPRSHPEPTGPAARAYAFVLDRPEVDKLKAMPDFEGREEPAVAEDFLRFRAESWADVLAVGRRRAGRDRRRRSIRIRRRRTEADEGGHGGLVDHGRRSHARRLRSSGSPGSVLERQERLARVRIDTTRISHGDGTSSAIEAASRSACPSKNASPSSSSDLPREPGSSRRRARSGGSSRSR